MRLDVKSLQPKVLGLLDSKPVWLTAWKPLELSGNSGFILMPMVPPPTYRVSVGSKDDPAAWSRVAPYHSLDAQNI